MSATPPIKRPIATIEAAAKNGEGSAGADGTGNDGAARPAKRRQSRFSDAVSSDAAAGAPPPPAGSVAAPTSAAEKAANLKARIEAMKAAKSSNLPSSGLQTPMQQSARPEPPRSASLGGAKTPLPPADFKSIPVAPVSSLKINRNQQRQEKLKRVMKVDKRDMLETDPAKNQYFDTRLHVKDSSRAPRKEFRFIEPGTVEARAERIREKKELERIQEELRQRERASASAPSVLLIREEHTEEPPDVEWWDVPFLVSGSYNDLDTDAGSLENGESKLRLDRVTQYVHHPVPVKVAEEPAAPPMPLMLTKQERRKLRHQKRMKREQDRQQMIQMGLMEAPPPKVKLSNMMRVLATEASQDPTKVEAEVRRQMEERQREHEARNEARKPTEEERREKQAEKVDQDRNSGLRACVFRVRDLSNPQHRFKVDMNAEQNHLTGCAIYHGECNVVVVEGGEKMLRRFKKLMLRRIDWQATAEELLPKDDEARGGDNGTHPNGSAPKRRNRCVLVWEGPILRTAFKNFMATPIPTEHEVRMVFRRRRVEHYWDLVLAFPIDDETAGISEI